MKTRLLLTLAALAAVTAASGSMVVDFGDYADNPAFLAQWSNNGGGASSPGFSLAGGVVGLETGTWGGAAYDTTMNYTGGTYNFAADTTTSVSTLFQFIADTGTGTPALAQVGLSTETGGRFRDESTYNFISGRLLRIDALNYRLDYQSRDGSTLTQVTGANFAVSGLTANHWYLLSTTITKDTGTTVDASVSLMHFGADGMTPGSTLSTTSALNQDIGSALYNDTETYLGLRSLADNDRIAFGGISAIPEPGTIGLIALGLLLLFRRRR